MNSFIKFLSLFFISTSLFGQSLYTENDKIKFIKTVSEGCNNKQNISELSKHLKKDVLQKTCQCYASEMANELFANIDFQIAFSKNNREKLKSIFESNNTDANNSMRMTSCIAKLTNSYGGFKNMVDTSNTTKSSSAVGLVGESRSSYVNSGVASCLNSVKDRSEAVKQSTKSFCTCTMNYIADRLSLDDLLNILKAKSNAEIKLNELSKLANKACS